MSEEAAYKLGPSRMDVAVRLASGAWMRLANKHTLTAAEIDEWVDLCTCEYQESTHQDLVDAYDKVCAERDELLAAQKVIEQAEKMGFSDNLFAQNPPSPATQRMLLLEQFGQHPDGLTVREAAEKAGLIGVLTYTSRFATDLITGGCLRVRTTEDGNGITTVVKRNRSKVYVITTDGYRVLRAGSST